MAAIIDNALDHCLEAHNDRGVSGLNQKIAEEVVNHLKLPCEFTHLDQTSFHYDGKASSDEEALMGITITTARNLIRGYVTLYAKTSLGSLFICRHNAVISITWRDLSG